MVPADELSTDAPERGLVRLDPPHETSHCGRFCIKGREGSRLESCVALSVDETTYPPVVDHEASATERHPLEEGPTNGEDDVHLHQHGRQVVHNAFMASCSAELDAQLFAGQLHQVRHRSRSRSHQDRSARPGRKWRKLGIVVWHLDRLTESHHPSDVPPGACLHAATNKIVEDDHRLRVSQEGNVFDVIDRRMRDEHHGEIWESTSDPIGRRGVLHVGDVGLYRTDQRVKDLKSLCSKSPSHRP